jgi:uncharacterized membrane protein
MNDRADADVGAGVVERNIAAMVARAEADAAHRGVEARVADAVTRFTGSMRFVYLHLLIFGLWIAWNLGAFGLPRFDASFVTLAMVASVEAIFLSTFVLISQNRMNELADERADLHLQIGLLSEHEITRLVTLMAAIGRKVGVEEADDEEIPELEQDVHPERVLDALHRHRSDGH